MSCTCTSTRGPAQLTHGTQNQTYHPRLTAPAPRGLCLLQVVLEWQHSGKRLPHWVKRAAITAKMPLHFSKKMFLQSSMRDLMTLTHYNSRRTVLTVPQRRNIHPQTLCLFESVRWKYTRKEREVIELSRFLFQSKMTDLRAWSLVTVVSLKTKLKLIPTQQQEKSSKSLLPV